MSPHIWAISIVGELSLLMFIQNLGPGVRHTFWAFSLEFSIFSMKPVKRNLSMSRIFCFTKSHKSSIKVKLSGFFVNGLELRLECSWSLYQGPYKLDWNGLNGFIRFPNQQQSSSLYLDFTWFCYLPYWAANNLWWDFVWILDFSIS